MALSSCTDAMAIAFFVRSVQEASVRAAREWVHVLDSVVFGTNPTPSALLHCASLPALGPSDRRGASEEHLLGEHCTPDAVKGQRASQPEPAPAPASEAASEEGADGNMVHSGRGLSLRHRHSFASSPALTSTCDADAATARNIKPPLLAHAAAGESGSTSSSRGDEDDLMSICARQACKWPALETPSERRSLLIKSRKFVRVLRELGTKLVDINPALREQELKLALERVNSKIPAGLYIPLLQRQYAFFYVLSILPEEARVFSTNKRCPFLCVAEIEVKTWRQAGEDTEAASDHETQPLPPAQDQDAPANLRRSWQGLLIKDREGAQPTSPPAHQPTLHVLTVLLRLSARGSCSCMCCMRGCFRWIVLLPLTRKVFRQARQVHSPR